MEPLQLVALSAGRGDATDLARSALPGAPIVASADRPERARRTRGVVAGALYRLGDAVAPAPAGPAAV